MLLYIILEKQNSSTVVCPKSIVGVKLIVRESTSVQKRLFTSIVQEIVMLYSLQTEGNQNCEAQKGACVFSICNIYGLS